jgi:hypothetical protein
MWDTTPCHWAVLHVAKDRDVFVVLHCLILEYEVLGDTANRGGLPALQ